MSERAHMLGWGGIVRLGLVQTALGAVVVLSTSTLNRVMVVELGLAAMVPGALVALHYVVQLLRPRFGHGSDNGGRRTPWIIGGMAALAAGGALAAFATIAMREPSVYAAALAIFAYCLIGGGVGAAGTSLLALVAKRVAPERRAPAAAIMWIMMIAGFVLTAGVAGRALQPYSPERLLLVTSVVSLIAFAIATVAVIGVEGRRTDLNVARTARMPFATAWALVWSEAQARQFTVFVMISMLAYSAQDLILEPFAGLVFNMSPGESTQLAGMQNAGVLFGMVCVALLARRLRNRMHSMRTWAVGGCIASAAALLCVALSGASADPSMLRLSVVALGVGNGVFAVAAIGSMMEMASDGHRNREGARVGLWGAAQAIAFACGGFAGAAAVDATSALFSTSAVAYAVVFVAEAILFLAAARLARRIGGAPAASSTPSAEYAELVSRP